MNWYLDLLTTLDTDHNHWKGLAGELFAASSEGFRPTVVFAGNFCEQLSSVLASRSLVDIRDKIEYVASSFRIYREGFQLSYDPETLKNFISDPGSKLLIVNKLERFFPELATIFAPLCLALSKDSLLPAFELTLFQGQQAETSFGIHKDELSDSIHFHVNGDQKIMRFYSDDGEQVTHTIRLEKGFAGYLPTQALNHCGYYSGSSTSLALALFKYKSTDIDGLLSEKYRRPVNPSPEALRLLVESENLEERIAYHQELDRDTITEVMLRKSNCWLRFPPVFNSEKIPENIALRLVLPFRLHTLICENRVSLFARGYELQLPTHPKLAMIIASINTGTAFSTESLAADYAVSFSFMKSLISSLWQLNALQHG